MHHGGCNLLQIGKQAPTEKMDNIADLTLPLK
jgi:hypothetical protein